MEDGSITITPHMETVLEAVITIAIGVIGTAITLTFRMFNSWMRSKMESEKLKTASEELDKIVDDTVRKGSSTLFSEFQLAAEDGEITREELDGVLDATHKDIRVQLGDGHERIRGRLGLTDEAMSAMLRTRIEAEMNRLVTKVTLKSAIQVASTRDSGTTAKFNVSVTGDGEAE